MKKIAVLLYSLIVGLFIVLLFGTGEVLAQTPEDEAKKHGITFPIIELGNCSDFNSCRTFCEDPVNQNTCIDFAKKKGFHKEDQSSKKDEIVKAAQSELGCDSEESCRSFCSQESNYDKCSSFAQKHNLSGGQTTDPSKSQILEKAKTILGCDSPSSCKTFCEQEANREKCSEFAKQTGLRGGEQQAGPGGCTSEETCKAFCSDPANFHVCSRFQSSVNSDIKDFRGPGGCNSEESCRAYCQSHPNECGHSGSTERNYDPIEMCNKTPSCSWTNNTCQCSSGGTGGTSGDYEKFCRENPEKCQGFHPRPSGNINPEDYCKQYPERCNFTPYPSASSVPNYTPYPNYSPQPYSSPSSGGTGGYNYPSQDHSSQCASTPGCTWTGTTCQCSGTQTQNTTKTLYPTNQPASAYESSPTYQSPPAYEQPSSGTVQGTSTQGGFFENLLRLIITSK